MPPVRHRPLLCCPESTWHVGSDDFTLPSLFAIVSRLILLGLTVGTIVYLLFPADCSEDEDDRIPPLLYTSLFVFQLMLFLTLINEAVIFSISLRGRIHDTNNRRKYFPLVLEIRIIFIVVELLTLILTTIGVFDPKYGGEAIECEDYRDGPLVFAKVITCIMWFLWILVCVGVFVAIDPLGFCSPSILHDIVDLGELGEKLDEDGFIMPEIHDEETDGSRRKRKYYVQLGHRKFYRRFKALCCCFKTGGNRSSSLAMHDAAKALHTMFGDLDLVPSDVVAGLVLLHRDQKKKMLECKCEVCTEGAEGSCECLTQELRDLTFKHMPEGQKPEGYVRHKQRSFNFDDPLERALFDDVLHYMYYCMGIYGWTLHVFWKPFTGLCSLGSMTCCQCNFRCCHSRAGVDFLNDDLCLCGVGSMRLHSKRQEEDIVFITYENEVYQVPFSLSLDHDQETVVLTIRGTLSIKDTLTDLSVTMVKVKIPGVDSDELYMHNGMYRTAQWIKNRIHNRRSGEGLVQAVSESMTKKETTNGNVGESSFTENKEILRTTMEKYWNYQLIITGHSLGAGVAAILAVLLKPAYPFLHCYAYSPPGCIFSLPVAQYSESFITTTILGNDLVSRTSFRSLLYMKKQASHLLEKCKKPKPQVLFQKPWIEKVFSKVTENPTVTLDDVKEGLVPEKRTLGIREIVLAKRFAKKAKEKIRRKSTVHIYIRNINQGDHIASFPPGKILHMEFTKHAKPLCLGLCYPTEMKLTWKSFEDFSAIAVDKGMVEDHLPTSVLSSLKHIKRQYIHRQYDPKETERIRIDARKRYQEKMADKRKEDSVAGDARWRQPSVEEVETREFQNVISQDKNGDIDSTRTPRSVTVAVTLEDPDYYRRDNGTEERNGRTNDAVNGNETLGGSTTAAAANMFVQALTKTSASQQGPNDVKLEMEPLPETATTPV